MAGKFKRGSPDMQHRLVQATSNVQRVPVPKVGAQRLRRHHAVFQQLQASALAALTITERVQSCWDPS